MGKLGEAFTSRCVDNRPFQPSHVLGATIKWQGLLMHAAVVDTTADAPENPETDGA